MKGVLTFIWKSRRDIAIFIIAGVIFHWMYSVITPKIEKIETYESKIDSLQAEVKIVYEHQEALDEDIFDVKDRLFLLGTKIDNVENQKVIIKEIYEKKTDSISSYDANQLNKFFTDRYRFQ